MKLLKLIEHKIVISPEALLINEYEALWKRDKSVKKEFALRELAYVYYLCDYDSIYQAYPKDSRDEKIRKDLNDGKLFKVSRECKKAIEKYKELQKTPTMEFLDSVKSAMESMTEYFNNIDFSERDDKNAAVYKPTEVTRCAKDAGGIVESVEKLKEKVKSEIYSKGTSKAGAEINPFEE